MVPNVARQVLLGGKRGAADTTAWQAAPKVAPPVRDPHNRSLKLPPTDVTREGTDLIVAMMQQGVV